MQINTTEHVSQSTSGTWVKCDEPCPHCGCKNTEYRADIVLTSLPPKFEARCLECHHTFYTPTTPPNFDRIYDVPYTQNSSWGWICQKCGASVSPYERTCPHCSGYYTITTSGTNSMNDILNNTYYSTEGTTGGTPIVNC